MNYIYGLFYDDPEPKCIYIGVTSRTVQERFKEHSRDMRNTSTTKDLYFFIRQKNIADRIYVEQISEMDENADTDIWEDFWIRELITAGHPLQNSISGNKKIAKKREARIDLLKEAEVSVKRQEVVEEWYERKNGKMVEIVEPKNRKTLELTARIRAPMLKELIDANWVKFDKTWEVFKWGELVLKRKQCTKKKREVKAENHKTMRKLELLDHECDDFTGLYIRLIDRWVDEGWGSGTLSPLKNVG